MQLMVEPEPNRMFQYHFEKLESWQLARALNKELYILTDTFPKREQFGLTAQIRRAGISITSNLAEGVSRSTPRAQASFTEIAFGSLMEVLCQLTVSADIGYITEEQLTQLRPRIEKLSNKLNALRKSQAGRIK